MNENCYLHITFYCKIIMFPKYIHAKLRLLSKIVVVTSWWYHVVTCNTHTLVIYIIIILKRLIISAWLFSVYHYLHQYCNVLILIVFLHKIFAFISIFLYFKFFINDNIWRLLLSITVSGCVYFNKTVSLNQIHHIIRYILIHMVSKAWIVWH